MSAPSADYDVTLIEQLEHFTHRGLTQPKCLSELRRTIDPVWVVAHMGQYECAVVNDFANAQHIISASRFQLNISYIVPLWYCLSQTLDRKSTRLNSSHVAI